MMLPKPIRDPRPGPDLLSATPESLAADLKQAGRDNDTVYFPIAPKEAALRFMDVFACHRGGACCVREMSNQNNGIYVRAEEIEALAATKGLKPQEFIDRHCMSLPQGGIAMRYPCPFYKDGCAIYNERPIVCRYFPLDIAELPGEGWVVGVQAVCPGGRQAAAKLLQEIAALIKEVKE